MVQTEFAPDRRSAPRTPRWVKVLGIIALVLVLVFITLHLTGHSPMNHMPVSPTDQGMQMP